MRNYKDQVGCASFVGVLGIIFFAVIMLLKEPVSFFEGLSNVLTLLVVFFIIIGLAIIDPTSFFKKKKVIKPKDETPSPRPIKKTSVEHKTSNTNYSNKTIASQNSTTANRSFVESPEAVRKKRVFYKYDEVDIDWYNSLEEEWKVILSQAINKDKLAAPNKNDLLSVSNIKKLSIVSRVTEDLSPLMRLSELEELTWIGWESYPSNIHPLKKLTGLKRLSLIQTQLNDLNPISDLIELNFLRIELSKISDIKPIGNLINLNRLILDDNNIEDIETLKSLSRLESLSLKNNNINILQPLLSLKQLRSLDLAHCNIPDISILKNMSSLRYLKLRGNNLSQIQKQDLKETLISCKIVF
ncbi:hypothetical protein CW736_13050 [Nonlabens sp. MB-3u-79]|uniref:leucine-rich repeat domain-containing protein n=1 Tax=Nonlabens sp. MB-3u-79 TaxID=2058134 RepID=UPI000C306EA3|nr:leucine-rich repeat domain-containing protein [Nonlabens sp. MB-3u-79]AUC80244.1 hypothetical protein CW736_13050 [Nonlabens sp. MB-3u-79]